MTVIFLRFIKLPFDVERLSYPHYGKWIVTDMSVTSSSGIDWIGIVKDRKSTFGGYFYFGNNFVVWHSKKQNAISLLTIEAEYTSACACCT